MIILFRVDANGGGSGGRTTLDTNSASVRPQSSPTSGAPTPGAVTGSGQNIGASGAVQNAGEALRGMQGQAQNPSQEFNLRNLASQMPAYQQSAMRALGPSQTSAYTVNDLIQKLRSAPNRPRTTPNGPHQEPRLQALRNIRIRIQAQMQDPHAHSARLGIVNDLERRILDNQDPRPEDFSALERQLHWAAAREGETRVQTQGRARMEALWQSHESYRLAQEPAEANRVLDQIATELRAHDRGATPNLHDPLSAADRNALLVRVIRAKVQLRNFENIQFHLRDLRAGVQQEWDRNTVAGRWEAHALLTEYSQLRQEIRQNTGAGVFNALMLDDPQPSDEAVRGRLPEWFNLVAMTARLQQENGGAGNLNGRVAHFLQLSRAHAALGNPVDCLASVGEMEGLLRHEGQPDALIRGLVIQAYHDAHLDSAIPARVQGWLQADERRIGRMNPQQRYEMLQNWATLASGLEEVGASSQEVVSHLQQRVGRFSLSAQANLYNQLFEDLSRSQGGRGLSDRLKGAILAPLHEQLSNPRTGYRDHIAIRELLIAHSDNAQWIHESVADLRSIAASHGFDDAQMLGLQGTMIRGLLRERGLLEQARNERQQRGEDVQADHRQAQALTQEARHLIAEYRQNLISAREGLTDPQSSLNRDGHGIQLLNSHYQQAMNLAYELDSTFVNDDLQEQLAFARGETPPQRAPNFRAQNIYGEYQQFLSSIPPPARIEGLVGTMRSLAERGDTTRLREVFAPMLRQTLAEVPEPLRVQALIQLSPAFGELRRSLELRAEQTRPGYGNAAADAVLDERDQMAGLEAGLWQDQVDHSSNAALREFSRSMVELANGHPETSRNILQGLLNNPQFRNASDPGTLQILQVAHSAIGGDVQARTERILRVVQSLASARQAAWLAEGHTGEMAAIDHVYRDLPRFLSTLPYDQLPNSFVEALDRYAAASTDNARWVRQFEGAISRIPLQHVGRDGHCDGSVWDLIRSLDHLENPEQVRQALQQLRRVVHDDISWDVMSEEGRGDLGAPLQDVAEMLLEATPRGEASLRDEIARLRHDIPGLEEYGQWKRETFNYRTALECAMMAAAGYGATFAVEAVMEQVAARWLAAAARGAPELLEGLQGLSAAEQAMSVSSRMAARSALRQAGMGLGDAQLESMLGQVLGAQARYRFGTYVMRTTLHSFAFNTFNSITPLMLGHEGGEILRPSLDMAGDTMINELMMSPIAGILPVPRGMLGGILMNMMHHSQSVLSFKIAQNIRHQAILGAARLSSHYQSLEHDLAQAERLYRLTGNAEHQARAERIRHHMEEITGHAPDNSLQGLMGDFVRFAGQGLAERSLGLSHGQRHEDHEMERARVERARDEMVERVVRARHEREAEGLFGEHGERREAIRREAQERFREDGEEAQRIREATRSEVEREVDAEGAQAEGPYRGPAREAHVEARAQERYRARLEAERARYENERARIEREHFVERHPQRNHEILFLHGLAEAGHLENYSPEQLRGIVDAAERRHPSSAAGPVRRLTPEAQAYARHLLDSVPPAHLRGYGLPGIEMLQRVVDEAMPARDESSNRRNEALLIATLQGLDPLEVFGHPHPEAHVRERVQEARQHLEERERAMREALAGPVPAPGAGHRLNAAPSAIQPGLQIQFGMGAAQPREAGNAPSSDVAGPNVRPGAPGHVPHPEARSNIHLNPQTVAAEPVMNAIGTEPGSDAPTRRGQPRVRNRARGLGEIPGFEMNEAARHQENERARVARQASTQEALSLPVDGAQRIAEPREGGVERLEASGTRKGGDDAPPESTGAQGDSHSGAGGDAQGFEQGHQEQRAPEEPLSEAERPTRRLAEVPPASGEGHEVRILRDDAHTRRPPNVALIDQLAEACVELMNHTREVNLRGALDYLEGLAVRLESTDPSFSERIREDVAILRNDATEGSPERMAAAQRLNGELRRIEAFAEEMQNRVEEPVSPVAGDGSTAPAIPRASRNLPSFEVRLAALPVELQAAFRERLNALPEGEGARPLSDAEFGAHAVERMRNLLQQGRAEEARALLQWAQAQASSPMREHVSEAIALHENFSAQAARSAEQSAPAAEVTPPRDEAWAKAQKVLIVDDEPAVARGFSRPLRPLGHSQIEMATSGQEALDRAAEDPSIAVITMDYGMPGMNGVEAARRLRAQGFQGPILFITGDANLLGVAEIPNSIVLQKPVPPAELSRHLVEQLLRTANAEGAPSANTPGPTAEIFSEMRSLFDAMPDPAMDPIERHRARVEGRDGVASIESGRQEGGGGSAVRETAAQVVIASAPREGQQNFIFRHREEVPASARHQEEVTVVASGGLEGEAYVRVRRANGEILELRDLTTDMVCVPGEVLHLADMRASEEASVVAAPSRSAEESAAAAAQQMFYFLEGSGRLQNLLLRLVPMFTVVSALMSRGVSLARMSQVLAVLGIRMARLHANERLRQFTPPPAIEHSMLVEEGAYRDARVQEPAQAASTAEQEMAQRLSRQVFALRDTPLLRLLQRAGQTDQGRLGREALMQEAVLDRLAQALQASGVYHPRRLALALVEQVLGSARDAAEAVQMLDQYMIFVATVREDIRAWAADMARQAHARDGYKDHLIEAMPSEDVIANLLADHYMEALVFNGGSIQDAQRIARDLREGRLMITANYRPRVDRMIFGAQAVQALSPSHGKNRVFRLLMTEPHPEFEFPDQIAFTRQVFDTLHPSEVSAYWAQMDGIQSLSLLSSPQFQVAMERTVGSADANWVAHLSRAREHFESPQATPQERERILFLAGNLLPGFIANPACMGNFEALRSMSALIRRLFETSNNLRVMEHCLSLLPHLSPHGPEAEAWRLSLSTRAEQTDVTPIRMSILMGMDRMGSALEREAAPAQGVRVETPEQERARLAEEARNAQAEREAREEGIERSDSVNTPGRRAHVFSDMQSPFDAMPDPAVDPVERHRARVEGRDGLASVDSGRRDGGGRIPEALQPENNLQNQEGGAAEQMRARPGEQDPAAAAATPEPVGQEAPGERLRPESSAARLIRQVNAGAWDSLEVREYRGVAALWLTLATALGAAVRPGHFERWARALSLPLARGLLALGMSPEGIQNLFIHPGLSARRAPALEEAGAGAYRAGRVSDPSANRLSEPQQQWLRETVADFRRGKSALAGAARQRSHALRHVIEEALMRGEREAQELGDGLQLNRKVEVLEYLRSAEGRQLLDVILFGARPLHNPGEGFRVLMSQALRANSREEAREILQECRRRGEVSRSVRLSKGGSEGASGLNTLNDYAIHAAWEGRNLEGEVFLEADPETGLFRAVSSGSEHVDAIDRENPMRRLALAFLSNASHYGLVRRLPGFREASQSAIREYMGILGRVPLGRVIESPLLPLLLHHESSEQMAWAGLARNVLDFAKAQQAQGRALHDSPLHQVLGAIVHGNYEWMAADHPGFPALLEATRLWWFEEVMHRQTDGVQDGRIGAALEWTVGRMEGAEHAAEAEAWRSQLQEHLEDPRFSAQREAMSALLRRLDERFPRARSAEATARREAPVVAADPLGEALSRFEVGESGGQSLREAFFAAWHDAPASIQPAHVDRLARALRGNLASANAAVVAHILVQMARMQSRPELREVIAQALQGMSDAAAGSVWRGAEMHAATQLQINIEQAYGLFFNLLHEMGEEGGNLGNAFLGHLLESPRAPHSDPERPLLIEAVIERANRGEEWALHMLQVAVFPHHREAHEATVEMILSSVRNSAHPAVREAVEYSSRSGYVESGHAEESASQVSARTGVRVETPHEEAARLAREAREARDAQAAREAGEAVVERGPGAAPGRRRNGPGEGGLYTPTGFSIAGLGLALNSPAVIGAGLVLSALGLGAHYVGAAGLRRAYSIAAEWARRATARFTDAILPREDSFGHFAQSLTQPESRHQWGLWTIMVRGAQWDAATGALRVEATRLEEASEGIRSALRAQGYELSPSGEGRWIVHRSNSSERFTLHIQEVSSGGNWEPRVPLLDHPTVGGTMRVLARRASLESGRPEAEHYAEMRALIEQAQAAALRGDALSPEMASARQHLMRLNHLVPGWEGMRQEEIDAVVSQALAGLGALRAHFQPRPELTVEQGRLLLQVAGDPNERAAVQLSDLLRREQGDPSLRRHPHYAGLIEALVRQARDDIRRDPDADRARSLERGLDGLLRLNGRNERGERATDRRNDTQPIPLTERRVPSNLVELRRNLAEDIPSDPRVAERIQRVSAGDRAELLRRIYSGEISSGEQAVEFLEHPDRRLEVEESDLLPAASEIYLDARVQHRLENLVEEERAEFVRRLRANEFDGVAQATAYLDQPGRVWDLGEQNQGWSGEARLPEELRPLYRELNHVARGNAEPFASQARRTLSEIANLDPASPAYRSRMEAYAAERSRLARLLIPEYGRAISDLRDHLSYLRLEGRDGSANPAPYRIVRVDIRLKDAEDIVPKLARRGWDDMSGFFDLGGARVIVRNQREAAALASEIADWCAREGYELHPEDIQHKHSPSGYRAVHLNVRRNGQAVAEVQIQTPALEAWNRIEHQLVYKNPALDAALPGRPGQTYQDLMRAYCSAASDFLAARENGAENASRPERVPDTALEALPERTRDKLRHGIRQMEALMDRVGGREPAIRGPEARPAASLLEAARHANAGVEAPLRGRPSPEEARVAAILENAPERQAVPPPLPTPSMPPHESVRPAPLGEAPRIEQTAFDEMMGALDRLLPDEPPAAGRAEERAGEAEDNDAAWGFMDHDAGEAAPRTTEERAWQSLQGMLGEGRLNAEHAERVMDALTRDPRHTYHPTLIEDALNRLRFRLGGGMNFEAAMAQLHEPLFTAEANPDLALRVGRLTERFSAIAEENGSPTPAQRLRLWFVVAAHLGRAGVLPEFARQIAAANAAIDVGALRQAVIEHESASMALRGNDSPEARRNLEQSRRDLESLLDTLEAYEANATRYETTDGFLELSARRPGANREAQRAQEEAIKSLVRRLRDAEAEAGRTRDGAPLGTLMGIEGFLPHLPAIPLVVEFAVGGGAFRVRLHRLHPEQSEARARALAEQMPPDLQQAFAAYFARHPDSPMDYENFAMLANRCRPGSTPGEVAGVRRVLELSRQFDQAPAEFQAQGENGRPNGHRIRLTGEILGIGSGRTVFAGAAIDASGAERPVAVKMGGQNLAEEARAIGRFQAAGVDVQSYGFIRVPNLATRLDGRITITDAGMALCGVESLARGELVRGFQEIERLFEDAAARERIGDALASDIARLTAAGNHLAPMPGMDCQWMVEADGRAHWIDLESYPAHGDPARLSAQELEARYESARLAAGLPLSYRGRYRFERDVQGAWRAVSNAPAPEVARTLPHRDRRSMQQDQTVRRNPENFVRSSEIEAHFSGSRIPGPERIGSPEEQRWAVNGLVASQAWVDAYRQATGNHSIPDPQVIPTGMFFALSHAAGTDAVLSLLQSKGARTDGLTFLHTSEQVRYLRPARAGEALSAEIEVVGRGNGITVENGLPNNRSLLKVKRTFRNAAGEVVAECLSTFQFRPRQSIYGSPTRAFPAAGAEGRPGAVQPSQIDRFAEVSGDHQWLHNQAEVGREGGSHAYMHGMDCFNLAEAALPGEAHFPFEILVSFSQPIFAGDFLSVREGALGAHEVRAEGIDRPVARVSRRSTEAAAEVATSPQAAQALSSSPLRPTVRRVLPLGGASADSAPAPRPAPPPVPEAARQGRRRVVRLGEGAAETPAMAEAARGPMPEMPLRGAPSVALPASLQHLGPDGLNFLEPHSMPDPFAHLEASGASEVAVGIDFEANQAILNPSGPNQQPFFVIRREGAGYRVIPHVPARGLAMPVYIGGEAHIQIPDEGLVVAAGPQALRVGVGMRVNLQVPEAPAMRPPAPPEDATAHIPVPAPARNTPDYNAENFGAGAAPMPPSPAPRPAAQSSGPERRVVQAPPPPHGPGAEVIPQQGVQDWALGHLQMGVVIGSDTRAFADPTVAGQHCVVERNPDGSLFVQNIGHQRTYLVHADGRLEPVLQGGARVQQGQVIQVGNTRLRLVAQGRQVVDYHDPHLTPPAPSSRFPLNFQRGAYQWNGVTVRRSGTFTKNYSLEVDGSGQVPVRVPEGNAWRPLCPGERHVLRFQDGVSEEFCLGNEVWRIDRSGTALLVSGRPAGEGEVFQLAVAQEFRPSLGVFNPLAQASPPRSEAERQGMHYANVDAYLAADGVWYLRNRSLPEHAGVYVAPEGTAASEMMTRGRAVPPNSHIPLRHGQMILVRSDMGILHYVRFTDPRLPAGAGRGEPVGEPIAMDAVDAENVVLHRAFSAAQFEVDLEHSGLPAYRNGRGELEINLEALGIDANWRTDAQWSQPEPENFGGIRAFSHRGIGGKNHNEDRYAVIRTPDGRSIALVIDGMGGVAGGERAAEIARRVAQVALNAGQSLEHAIALANRAVRQDAARGNQAQNPVGDAIAVAVELRPNHYAYIEPSNPHARNSPARVIGNGDSLALVLDLDAADAVVYHSERPRQGTASAPPLTIRRDASGRAVRGQTLVIRQDPHSNVVNHGLRKDGHFDIDQPRQELRPGQLVLVGCDGFFENYGSHDIIADVLRARGARSSDQALAVLREDVLVRQALLHLARQAGCPLQITPDLYRQAYALAFPGQSLPTEFFQTYSQPSIRRNIRNTDGSLRQGGDGQVLFDEHAGPFFVDAEGNVRNQAGTAVDHFKADNVTLVVQQVGLPVSAEAIRATQPGAPPAILPPDAAMPPAPQVHLPPVPEPQTPAPLAVSPVWVDLRSPIASRAIEVRDGSPHVLAQGRRQVAQVERGSQGLNVRDLGHYETRVRRSPGDWRRLEVGSTHAIRPGDEICIGDPNRRSAEKFRLENEGGVLRLVRQAEEAPPEFAQAARSAVQAQAPLRGPSPLAPPARREPPLPPNSVARVERPAIPFASLRPGKSLVLGRQGEVALGRPEDRTISKRHATLVCGLQGASHTYGIRAGAYDGRRQFIPSLNGVHVLRDGVWHDVANYERTQGRRDGSAFPLQEGDFIRLGGAPGAGFYWHPPEQESAETATIMAADWKRNVSPAIGQGEDFILGHRLEGELHNGLEIPGRSAIFIEGVGVREIDAENAGEAGMREIIYWDRSQDAVASAFLDRVTERVRREMGIRQLDPSRPDFERQLDRALRIFCQELRRSFRRPGESSEEALIRLREFSEQRRGQPVLVGEILQNGFPFCRHLVLVTQAFLVDLGARNVAMQRGRVPGGAHVWNETEIGGQARRIIEITSPFWSDRNDESVLKPSGTEAIYFPETRPGNVVR